MSEQKFSLIWQEICNKIKNYENINPSQINAFFSRLKIQAMSEDYIMLTADTEFIKTWIERHYFDVIEKALFDIYGVNFSVAIEVDLSTSEEENKLNQPQLNPNNVNIYTPLNNNPYNNQLPPNQKRQFQRNNDSIYYEDYSDDVEKDLKTLLDDERSFGKIYKPDYEEEPKESKSSFTFENFVIGDSNKMAYSMAVSVAETPGKAHLNPLFIYGKSGLGKTHLMRAIQNYIQENMPKLSVIYVDSAELLSDYMEASAAHDKEKSSYKNFKIRYEEANVLLIDDIQYLQGKKQTLDIVFQIFNKMISQGKQIVLSADRAPKNIDIDERYQSRFNSGGTFDIQPPEVETKLGIVKAFIEEYKETERNSQFFIPEEIQMYIAENSSSNIRELKSAVTKVIYQMTFFNKPDLSLEEVKRILENHFSGGLYKKLTVADIQKEVENFFKISHTDLIGKKRTRNIIYARQIAIYLCRQMLDIAYSDIGKNFNRDHSTVMYSVTNIEEKMKENREICEEIETIKQIIREN